MAYEPMRQKVFGQPTFSKFLRGIDKEMSYLKSDDFRKDLQHLILVCTEYNKVYNAKTGSDTNRISKPKYEKNSKKEVNISTVKKTTDEYNLYPATAKSRERALSIVRKCLKNEHINEGNSVAFLDLLNRKNEVDSMCQQLNAIGKKNIQKRVKMISRKK